jgi:hypothetical protein
MEIRRPKDAMQAEDADSNADTERSERVAVGGLSGTLAPSLR